MTPISLPANVPPRFYRGGAAIAAFRGMREEAQRAPEDWIASTTALFGGGAGGLSLLPDGRTLRDAIQADPIAFLGPERVAEFGPDLGLLVKLLDAGERLPVHVHPDRSFASRHLGCRYGKTEGWVVLGTSGSEACVYLGFREPVPAQTLTRWVDEQDEAALLGALHRIPVAAGDTVLVPAGVPHAIGAGVFVLELQEPTDLSVLLEWKGYDLADPAEATLGLGWRTALSCVGREPLGLRELDHLRSSPRVDPATHSGGLFPPEADPYFRAEKLLVQNEQPLSREVSVVVVLEGEGRLASEQGDEVTLATGSTVLIPWKSGVTAAAGSLTLVRCRPPLLAPPH